MPPSARDANGIDGVWYAFWLELGVVHPRLPIETDG
jgi:hypothetical protein